MAKFCPILNHSVVYLTCLECEDKLCEQTDKNNKKNKRKEEGRDDCPSKEKE